MDDDHGGGDPLNVLSLANGGILAFTAAGCWMVGYPVDTIEKWRMAEVRLDKRTLDSGNVERVKRSLDTADLGQLKAYVDLRRAQAAGAAQRPGDNPVDTVRMDA